MQPHAHRVLEELRKHWALLLLYVGALCWLTQDLGLVPGLHADEAWTFLRTETSDTSGMNAYTSAFYTSCLDVFFGVAGKGIMQLRLFGVLTNVLGLFFALRLIRHLYPEKTMTFWMGALLLSSPAFVMLSRMAFELTALIPLLLWAGFFFVVSASQQREKHSILKLLLGGFLLGVACHTHLVALSVCVSVGVAWLSVHRRQGLIPSLLYVGIGFLAGFGPRIWAVLGSQRSGQILDIVLGQWGEKDFYLDLLALPLVMGDVLDGSLLYLRTVGGMAMPALPVFALLIGLLFWLLWRERARLCFSRTDAVLVLSFLLLPLVMRSFSGNTSLRYFVFNAHLLPLLLLSLLRGAGLFSAEPFLRRKFVQVMLATCVCVNVMTVQVNYFKAHRQSGGTHTLFSLGAVLRETSSHFVRSQELYDGLIAQGAKRVVSHYFISESLKALDWQNQRLDIVEEEMYAPPKRLGTQEERVLTYYVYYNTPMPGWPNWQWMQELETIRLNDVQLRRLQLGAPHFLVFVPSPEVAVE
ncbi:MAG: hypothetical protein QGI45_06855 [Myxococcota bacterium]|nr:hypothetical protein [Myxococcota bacterium]